MAKDRIDRHSLGPSLPVESDRPAGDRESQIREDGYRAAFDFAAVGMALISPEGRFVQVNHSFARMLGYRAGELLGGPWHTILVDDDQESDGKLLNQLLEAEIEFYHLERRFLHKDGHTVWGLQSVSLIRDAQGRPQHVLYQVQDITDRKHADEILQESEAMSRSLLESAPDAILMINEAGRIVLVNAQTEAMFGYRRDELLGNSVEMLLPARFQELYASRRANFFSQPGQGPMDLGGDLFGRRKDGSEFPMQVRLNPLAVKNQRLAVSIIRDITEQKRIEVELQNRALQEAAIAAFGRQAATESELPLLMDRATQNVADTLGVHFAAVSQLGPRGSTLTFKSLSFSATASPEDQARVDRAVVDNVGSFAGHAIRTGQTILFSRADEEHRFDLSVLRSFGVVSGVAVPLKMQDRPYGILAAYSMVERQFSTEEVHFLEAVAHLLSVTIERKVAEDAVRRDRDFAESLIQTADAIVLVLDTRGRILRFNPYTEELTGYRLDDLKGTDWCTTLMPAYSRQAGGRMFEAAATGQRLCRAVQPIITQDGEEHEIEWSGRALTDLSGAVAGVLFIGHDVTELKQAQRRVLETERLAAIGQMASGLAHESRNALQQIGACTEMLMMELEDNHDALDLVVGVQEAEERLHRLFEDVRAYAVPLRLNRRKTDVSKVWRPVWENLVAAHPERTLVLHEKVEEVDLRCSIDLQNMEQVFCNILENAVDACPDPVVIEIRCDDAALNDAPALMIEIKDDGPGLTAEQSERAFDAFYTTKTQGTGLGLAIARRVVEAHQGRLELESPSGGGAAFRITLPRETLDSAPTLLHK